MKLQILSILFLLFMVDSIQAQVKGKGAYLIKYEVDFVLDSTNRKDVDHEVHRLYTGATVSNYISEGRFFRDSLSKAMHNQSPSARRNMGNIMRDMPTTEFTPIVFKDLTNSEVWIKNAIASDQFIYQEPNVPIVWEFTEETKKIEQYDALKATTSYGGRNYEAWFTLEVPITDGPYVFSGLPGLILELYDTNMDYHFNLASISQLKEKFSINSAADNIKEITKNEFIKSYIKHRKNPASSIASKMMPPPPPGPPGEKTLTKKDIERQIKERVAKRNNQIEVWK